jgi:hypothetical protein
MTKLKVKIFIDGPKNEDWSKSDPVKKEEEIRAIEEAKALHQKELQNGTSSRSQ